MTAEYIDQFQADELLLPRRV